MERLSIVDTTNIGNNEEEGEVEDTLVIGIDFGTTYSGVAWATKAELEDKQINLITSWPVEGPEQGKVPTELWYNDEDEALWGDDIPADVEPFRWFKLLLLRDEDLGPELRHNKFVVRAKAMIEAIGKTPGDLVTDYLRLLWDHTLSTIERARGDTVVEALAFHVVMTVPAIWKSYARQAMGDAMSDAGILDYRLAGPTRLTFAPEPEAAALPTLLEQGSGVRPGNVYVICDAGGGTVDLISYVVKSTKPIVLEEIVEGTGGLCGGIFIDQVFESLCRGRLGTKWKRLSETGLKNIMKKEWEQGIKPQFKPNTKGKEYVVSLPAELFRGEDDTAYNDTRRVPHIKNGKIHFQSSDIEKTFVDIFAKIASLVSKQISEATRKCFSVTGVILVGGLGASPYLYDYLKSASSDAGIAVLQLGGMRPRTAICRGAVHKGFLEQQNHQREVATGQPPIAISSTVSRSSYGLTFTTVYSESKHLFKDKFWCTRHDEWRAKNQMGWYLTRGQTVARAKPIRHSWTLWLAPEEFDGTITTAILQCDDDIPPTRRTKSVKLLATFDGKLGIKYADLPKHTAENGKEYGVLEFDFEMVPSGASVELALYVGGRRHPVENGTFRFA